MYEYTLFGQVNESRQTQLLQVLAGISAMQPHTVRERHLIFRPTRPPTRAVAQVGGSQAIQDTAKLAARQNQNAATDLYFIKLVEDLEIPEISDDQDVKSKQPNGTADDENVRMENGLDHEDDVHDMTSTTQKDEVQQPGSKWRMVFQDVPEPGKRPVTARMMNITEITDGDAVGFMEGLGYTFVTQFLQSGYSFTHHNTALTLTRSLLMPEAVAAQSRLRSATLPAASEFKPLDSSGAFTLQAAVTVLDASKPEVVSRATSELLQFKETMKGVVDMRVVERLALDTRVK